MASGTVTGDPIPTKFDAAEEKLIRSIKQVTGLPMAQIIKRAARFALPKFASGEISILTLEPSVTPRPLEFANSRAKKNGNEVARA